MEIIKDRKPELGTQKNEEWELCELIQLITAEVDLAQDVLRVKSHNRRLSMMVNQLELDLQVNVRCDPEGKLLFRTTSSDQNSMTVLKLGFNPVLDTHLQDNRKSLEMAPEEHYALETLANISAADIQKLKTLSIYSTADLVACTPTPTLITEVSQKAGIEEARIRAWRQLPYIETLQPEQGLPGSVVVITGDNFRPSDVKVFFQNQPVTICQAESTATRLTVEMPKSITGSGVLIVEVDGQQTNPKTWTAEFSALAVQTIVIDGLNPSLPMKPGLLRFEATCVNTGRADTGEFQVQWELLDQLGAPISSPQLIACPSISAGKIITSTVQFNCQKDGIYLVRCTADPDKKLPNCLRTNQTFTMTFAVSSLVRLF